MVDIAESLVGDTRQVNSAGGWSQQGDTSAFFLAAEFGNVQWGKVKEKQHVTTAEAIAGLLDPATLE